tara:strand:+ start:1027 stop:1737 length:711 start_codon:yes stop_codon:yes gene_type:complete
MFLHQPTFERTKDQIQLLSKPWLFSLEGLGAADFTGDQLYIDWWVSRWLKTNDIDSSKLPLCVEESIHCDKKLKRLYRKAIKQAVIYNRREFLQQHFIIKSTHWNVVDFNNTHQEIVQLLWQWSPAPLDLLPFVIQGRRIQILTLFTEHYGPSACLRECVLQQWSEGVRECLEDGADIQGDCVGLAVRHPDIFRQLTVCNPKTVIGHWNEFCLQLILKRVPDIPLVEEWFWIHGFK